MVRHLIVNADDLGMSDGINAGIARACDEGIVTSTSLMVRQPAAEAGVTWAEGRPDISVGIHVDLCEWEHDDGAWVALYARVDLDDPVAVAAEVDHQLDLFRTMVGGPPTHVDSHQHVHRDGVASAVIGAAAARLRIPLRDSPPVTYLGSFYGQDQLGRTLPGFITAEALADLIEGLRQEWTELGCHPGFADDVDTSYRDERRHEVEALCAPEVRDRLDAAGVTLSNFRDVPWPG